MSQSDTSSSVRPAGRSYRGLKAAERRAIRRQQLLDAGLYLFGTNGYVATTVKDVCRQAALSERYFYESFNSKEDLLSATYQMITDRLKDQFIRIMGDSSLSREALAHQSVVMFYTHMQDPVVARVQLFEILGVSARMDGDYQQAMQELAGFIGLALRAIFPDIPASRFESGTVGAALAGAMIQVANTWMMQGYKQPLSDLVEEMLGLMWTVGEKLEAA